ncbi:MULTISPECIES: hypothetical protein [Cyanophyceae]|uniref:Uncharacterized protein n=1 Tax=Leptolyngbya subtilissima DQ-A4 TaxID=2933933 RepID=A0ABV0K8R2_9CYAN|nr:hypothetical protein [Nodosilinea sp. FACHB-141]MBD2110328.1 hypothetical protein [Nodosilinea sp. FACHB-141]
MDKVSRYWHLMRLYSAGHSQAERLPHIHNWLLQTYGALLSQAEDGLPELQKALLQLWWSEANQADRALLSLRCFVSHHIRDACAHLARQFGEAYGFTTADLLVKVLDDHGRPLPLRPSEPLLPGDSSSASKPPYRPFTAKILDSYVPDLVAEGQPKDPSDTASENTLEKKKKKAALSTWCSRLTCNHPGLNQLLISKGLYRVSDWAILNDTSPAQMQRILRTYHLCSEYEVATATTLLEQYQAVYRRDRLNEREKEDKKEGENERSRRCQPPTPEQLAKINPKVSDEALLAQLSQLASQLRQYRIHIRGGTPTVGPSEPIDWEQVPAANPVPDEQDEFLQGYRQVLKTELKNAIDQTIRTNVDRLSQKDAMKAKAYIQGLHLFHCKGMAMGKLATHLGLNSQVQVNRLLELKRLRADVRHQLIAQIYPQVRRQALDYISADRLHAIDQTLEQLLTEDVDQIIEAAAAESQSPKRGIPKSLFARQLCRTIDQFMPDSE